MGRKPVEVVREAKLMPVNKKIYVNISIVFFTGVILIMVIVMLFLRMYLLRNTQVQADRIATEVSSQLMGVFNEAEKLCNIIGKNYDIQESIRNPQENDLAAQAKERTNINGKISQLTQSYTANVDNICVLLEDGRKFKYGTYSNRSDDIQNEQWYQRLYGSKEFQWLGVQETSLALHSLDWKCIVGGVRLTNMRSNEACGVIVAEIDIARLKQIINQYASEATYIELRQNQTDSVLWASNWDSAVQSPTSRRPLTEYFTINVYYRNMVMDSDTLFLMVLLVAVAILISILMMHICTKSLRRGIVYPLETLLKVVNRFENTNTSPDIDVQTDILEISRLIKGVEELFGRVERLLQMQKEEQKVIRRAQVAALQEQINPHFLYNTMDSISWLIRKKENDKALNTIHSFATLFRLSLNNGKNYVTIEEELNYIRYYIDILNVRYNNQIAYEFTIKNPKVQRSYIPKLILQPLVENSIEHGIGMRDDQAGKIHITVDGNSNGVCIEILDDGIGIPREKLDEINVQLLEGNGVDSRKQKSYGIFNVNKRLRVAYGLPYGIFAESEYEAYTLVKMLAPICNEKGEPVNEKTD